MWAIQGNVEVLGEVGDEDDVDDAGGALVLVRRALPTSPSCSSYFFTLDAFDKLESVYLRLPLPHSLCACFKNKPK